MNQKDREILKTWCRFLGYGNPRARLWIVGIEEGGGFDSESPETYFANGPDKHPLVHPEIGFTYGQNDEEDAKSVVGKQGGRQKNNQTWGIAGWLALQLGLVRGNGRGDQKEQAKSLHLMSRDSPVFLSNLFPLGKPDTKVWPYRSILNRDEYVKEVLGEEGNGERRRLFGKAMGRFRPVVVVHGKGYWGSARQIFGLTEGGEARNGFECYRSRRVILAPHFTRMSYDLAGALAEEIRPLLL